jgi:hypothetical protein
MGEVTSNPQKMEEYFADLHVLASIEVICTQSILRTDSGRRLASKIAKLCRDGQALQLRGYDRERAKGSS